MKAQNCFTKIWHARELTRKQTHTCFSSSPLLLKTASGVPVLSHAIWNSSPLLISMANTWPCAGMHTTLSGRMIWNFPTTPGLCYQGFLKLLKCNSWKMSCFYVLLKIVSVFTTWNYLIKHLMKKYNNLDNRFSRFQRQQIQVAFFPVKKLFFSKLFGSYCYNMSLNMSSTCLQINLTKILLENPQIGLTSA